jgi:hypothetical protein
VGERVPIHHRPRRRRAAVAVVALVTVGAASLVPSRAGAQPGVVTEGAVPVPSVSGPVTGGNGPFDVSSAPTLSLLPQYGYVQEEFFIEGTARAYGKVGTWRPDGRWKAEVTTTAPYKTRLLVRRPADPSRFNGTVVVEWLNVTAGFDAAAGWLFSRQELLRGGYVWVGVSAQETGVEGGLTGFGFGGLKLTDPARYGSLTHPGDAYSYDIYSQAGAALRSAGDADPLGGLGVDQLLAAGESQSAFRLVTYVNAVDRLTGVYDAFLIHSRFARGAPLFEAPDGLVPVPSRVRRGLRVPVLVFQSETDVPRYVDARRSDSHLYREWEAAGTSHFDEYSLGIAVAVLGCERRVNAGPEHFLLHTALAALRRWAADHGDAPPHGPNLKVDPATGAIVRDRHGNALGGIRTPQLDVPVAALSGEGQTGSGFCSLFGTTNPFDEATLRRLYPSREQYLDRYARALRRAVRRGFILEADVPAILFEAALSPIPA